MEKKELFFKCKRISKSWFVGFSTGVVITLAVVRCAYPDIAVEKNVDSEDMLAKTEHVEGHEPTNEKLYKKYYREDSGQTSSTERGAYTEQGHMISFHAPDGTPKKHKILSVPGFSRTFPDLQNVQIEAARKWGVSPVEDRKEAEKRKDELVYVGSNPYYTMDNTMNYSIPYLVPRASNLLQRIGRNFMDSLAIKQIPLHSLIVTSVLRTESDVRRLRRVNYNASSESCHRYGTTFDICYNRYNAIEREVRNDTLKWVLAEVLRDLRTAGDCYVKYEVKQGCFHITVR